MKNNGNGAYYFIRQGIFALLGLAVMFALSKLNYQRLRGVGRLLLWALHGAAGAGHHSP